MSIPTAPKLPRKRPQRPVAAPRPQQAHRVHSAPVLSTSLLASDEVVDLDAVDLGDVDGDFVNISPLEEAVELDSLTTVPAPAPATTASRPCPVKAASAIEPTPAKSPSKENKKKRNRLRITDNDIDILEAVNWMGRATMVHIAIAVGNPVANISKRVRQLVDGGYLMAYDKNEVIVYGLAADGVVVLKRQQKTDQGEGGNVVRSKEPVKAQTRKRWALATLAHRNKINTAVCLFKVGGNAFEERKMREFASFAREQERRNARTRESNIAMLERQERIRAIPEEQRTLSEHRYLTYRPRSLATVPTVPEPTRYGEGWFGTPQAALAEEAIKLAITAKGEAEGARDWMETVRQVLTNPNYPVRRPGDKTPVSDAERQAMYDIGARQAWVYQHWNTGEGGTRTFEQRHRPDGVILRPHLVQPDGSVLARSIWLEVEENGKDVDAVKLVCRQAMDHPLVQRVLYLTNKDEIRDMVNDAIKELAEEMLWSVDFNREMNGHDPAMTDEQKLAVAQGRVKQAAKVVDAPLLNERVRSGLWG